MFFLCREAKSPTDRCLHCLFGNPTLQNNECLFFWCHFARYNDISVVKPDFRNNAVLSQTSHSQRQDEQKRRLKPFVFHSFLVKILNPI